MINLKWYISGAGLLAALVGVILVSESYVFRRDISIEDFIRISRIQIPMEKTIASPCMQSDLPTEISFVYTVKDEGLSFLKSQLDSEVELAKIQYSLTEGSREILRKEFNLQPDVKVLSGNRGSVVNLLFFIDSCDSVVHIITFI